MNGVEYKDYYKILGVEKSATQEEIKKEFRNLARTFHPDKVQGSGKAAAEEKFKEIAEAYEVLGDPEKRKEYDALGQRWEQMKNSRSSGFSESANRQSPNFNYHFDGTGFSDFFEQFFGGGQHGFGSRHSTSDTHFSMRGQDIEAEIMITLEEALHGSNRQVSLAKVDPATGTEKVHTYKVRIPQGIQEGQRLRVSRQGYAGYGSGEPGDLYLRARFAKHPDFRVKGSDLYSEIELFPWDAVLGTSATIPTLDGNVRLKVPPNTTSGKTFRIRDKGLPLAKGSRGHLYVETRIKLPHYATPSQCEAWQKLKETYQNGK